MRENATAGFPQVTFVPRLLRRSVIGLAAALGLAAIEFFAVPPDIILTLGHKFAKSGQCFRWMLLGLVVWMPLPWSTRCAWRRGERRRCV